MHSNLRSGRRAALVLGASIAAVAGSVGAAVAAAPSHNEQVALVSGTGEQLEHESRLSGTGQVVSHDGQFTVFSTTASLSELDTNNTDDVYLRDAGDDVTVLVSEKNGFAGDDASFAPTISADGRYVAFSTFATNLNHDTIDQHAIQVVVKDMQTGKIEVASVNRRGVIGRGNSTSPVISDNGKAVSFQTAVPFGRRDDDKKEDVYVRDLVNDVTRQGSLTRRGQDIGRAVLNGDLSGDGRTVVFGNANNLWARDVVAGVTTRFWHEPDSPPCQDNPTGSVGRPAISGNGQYVAFATCATKIPGEDGAATDVYRLELVSGDIEPVHPAGNGNSYLPSLSRSGRYVGFGSEATNLVAGDTATSDAFVADVRENTVVRASQAPDGSAGNSDSGRNSIAISGDGQSLAYVSYASNLVEGDEFDLQEAFVWRR